MSRELFLSDDRGEEKHGEWNLGVEIMEHDAETLAAANLYK